MRNKNYEPWDQGTYQTGPTLPPKNHYALIAFLLIVVIVLCGLVMALSLVNIRLFQKLSSAQDSQVLPMSLLSKENTETGTYGADQTTREAPVSVEVHAAEQDALSRGSLGFHGETVSPFYQLYYGLPQGFYITAVDADSAAEKAGIQAGHIVLAVNGTPIPDAGTLTSILSHCQPGDLIRLKLYRNSREFEITFFLEEAE